MPQPSAHAEAWVRRYHPAPTSAVRLMCLPHAGGSASFFFPLSKVLSPEVEVLAVQYPGRQDRHAEPNIDNIPEFADQLFEASRHLSDRPLALFGHSMGAVLAYELALRMQRAGLPAPRMLFASGRRAPSQYRDEKVHQKGDTAIAAELRLLSGANAAVLADPDMVSLIMPALRSDYRAIETYRHDPDRRLDCPVTVLTGDSDPRVSAEEAADWREHTTGPTSVHTFSGGHFFHMEQSTQVTALLRQTLSNMGTRTGT